MEHRENRPPNLRELVLYSTFGALLVVLNSSIAVLLVF